MVKPILGTVGSRVTITLLNLLLVMATGKMLGVTGLGTISLIILGITLILLLSHVVGGGALAYLAPRYAGLGVVVRVGLYSHQHAFGPQADRCAEHAVDPAKCLVTRHILVPLAPRWCRPDGLHTRRLRRTRLHGIDLLDSDVQLG